MRAEKEEKLVATGKSKSDYHVPQVAEREEVVRLEGVREEKAAPQDSRALTQEIRRLLARFPQVVADAPIRVHHVSAGIAWNHIGV